MTKQIHVGSVAVGGGAPVSIQSMLNTRTTDVEGSLRQLRALAAAGCQIARLAVPDMDAAKGFAEIASASPLPLVADIHFDYRLAIAAAEGGAAKIRINPGNIGGEERVRAVVDACREKKIPIRIGVNGGSLDKRLLEKYGHPTPEALVESAFSHIELLEKFGFYDICVSMKSSSVPLMMRAYTLFGAQSDYPLHLGVTETGTEYMGTIKSAMGIGGLLCMGIGDTVRVSLTADPVREVYAAKAILKAAKFGAAAPAIPVKDTIKVSKFGGVDETPDRKTLFAVQTPQVFQANILKAALQSAIEAGAELTDDCSAVERLGKEVYLAPGWRENIKITTASDLTLAEALLRERENRA